MIDAVSVLMRNPWGTWLLGAANLVAPLLGFCLQIDGTAACPERASSAEVAYWILVTAYFWLSSLATQSILWRRGTLEVPS